MRIIKPEATHISKKGLTPYQFIELIGRTCYKSEDKIEEGSDLKFIRNLKNREHWAMIEHAFVHYELTSGFYVQLRSELELLNSPYKNYLVVSPTVENSYVITCSLRTVHDLLTIKQSEESSTTSLNYFLDMVFNDYPEIYVGVFAPRNCVGMVKEVKSEQTLKELLHYPEVIKLHIPHTIRFICDRGVSHELVRHRPASFAQESTRYCNYSLGKYGKEITVIEPCFWENTSALYYFWELACERAERDYFQILERGSTPQEARSVLPNSLKTEVIVTALENEWQHIINLRYHGLTGSPHPQMVEVMTHAYPILISIAEGRLS